MKGQDLFDASLFRSKQQTRCFYTFMAELKSAISIAMPTPTHSFIRILQDKGKLLRCYTQNIDCLEDTLDLSVVRLHGSMDKVKCTICAASFDFTSDYEDQFRDGNPPACPRCETYDNERIRFCKRQLTMGILRPSIVLYNEEHPDGETIGKLQTSDLKRKPDLMIVMGTSLKIPSLKKFIKQAAKLIHDSSKDGKVIFINKTPCTKEWDKVFDYEIIGDSDDWVDMIQEKMDVLQMKKDAKKAKAMSKNLYNDNTTASLLTDDKIPPAHEVDYLHETHRSLKRTQSQVALTENFHTVKRQRMFKSH
jgi:NAD-dependent histone deacetylase SIR2